MIKPKIFLKIFFFDFDDAEKVREREIRPKLNNGDIEGSRFLNRQRQETRFTQMPDSSSWRKGSNSHSQSLNNSSSDGRDSEEEQNEHIRASQVVREEEFVYFERINGKPTNVLQGLELHTGVFNAQEQRKIVECVYDLQTMGQRGQLRGKSLTNIGFAHVPYFSFRMISFVS